MNQETLGRVARGYQTQPSEAAPKPGVTHESMMLREAIEKMHAPDCHYGQRDPRPQAGEQGVVGRESSEDHHTHREQLRHGDRDGVSEDGSSRRGGSTGSLSQVELDPTYQEPACELGHLSEGQRSLLWNANQQVLPDAWNAVVNHGRLFLLEVACSPESTLTAEALTQGLAAKRASLHNGCDLTTPEGLRNTLEIVQKSRPQHVLD